MSMMDKYINKLLAEMPKPAQKNILDEPIPGAVKQRLLKPLLPGKPQPSRPPHMCKEQKRKAILEEFDPLSPQKMLRTIQDYQKEIFYQTPWTIGKFLQGRQMDISEGHPSGVDVNAFMQEVHPRIHKKLTEEILALNGIKFQLALKVKLQKDNPYGTEEFAVFRHKQGALLQAREIRL